MIANAVVVLKAKMASALVLYMCMATCRLSTGAYRLKAVARLAVAKTIPTQSARDCATFFVQVAVAVMEKVILVRTRAIRPYSWNVARVTSAAFLSLKQAASLGSAMKSSPINPSFAGNNRKGEIGRVRR